MSAYATLPSGMIVPASFAEALTAAPAETREIASTRDGRDVTRGFVQPMQRLQPQDTVLLARGAANYNLYREVLRDDQVGSVFAQRRLAVISRSWEVEAGGKSEPDKAAAAFLQEQLDNVQWDACTDKMLYGMFYGHAAAEMMWGVDGSFITIDRIKVRDRRRFVFDGDMNLRLLTMADTMHGERLPERKFWAFCTGADHDDEPYGLGLAHWLYWPVFFKRNGIKFWLIFLEKFGQPTAKGTYPGGATPEEKARLLAALGAIATDAGVILPEGMAIELIEAARSGTADYTELYDRMDAAIAKVVLGHTGSSDATPGRLGGEDNAHDVRQDIVKADADLICSSFNRGPARWLTEWNFPGAAVPRVWRQVDEGEDLEKRAKIDQALHEMGYEPESIEYINETYGGSWRKKPTPPPPPPGPLPARQPGAEFADPAQAGDVGTEDQEALEQAAAQFAQRWREVLGASVEELLAMAESTGDLVTFRERLTEIMANPPTEELVESLTRGNFIAHLMGRTLGDRS